MCSLWKACEVCAAAPGAERSIPTLLLCLWRKRQPLRSLRISTRAPHAFSVVLIVNRSERSAGQRVRGEEEEETEEPPLREGESAESRGASVRRDFLLNI